MEMQVVVELLADLALEEIPEAVMLATLQELPLAVLAVMEQ